MNKFIAVAFFVAAVYAQSAATQSLTTDELSFTGNSTDFNTTKTDGTTETTGQIYDIIVGSTTSDPSLVGSIDWMVTESGVNFLSFKLELYLPLTNFAVGAINTVYFQIEHPVVK